MSSLNDLSSMTTVLQKDKLWSRHSWPPEDVPQVLSDPLTFALVFIRTTGWILWTQPGWYKNAANNRSICLQDLDEVW